jgi:hypothetical protein
MFNFYSSREKAVILFIDIRLNEKIKPGAGGSHL